MDYYYSNKDKNTTAKMANKLRLKVCGMNANTSEVAALKPDYLGFIFWEPSKRYFDGDLPSIPHGIKKVGVFVDAAVEDIIEKVEKYQLLLVQLHGNESPIFCEMLRKKLPQIEIIKVFSFKDEFDFTALQAFEEVCDYYLFDTKGKLPGGNGYVFNWKVLSKYPSTKPFFLSGGIGLDETEAIQKFMSQPEAQYCYAIDVNSKFEIEPGLKDIEKLEKFKEILSK